MDPHRVQTFTPDVLTRFLRNRDGSWLCLAPANLAAAGASLPVCAGMTFTAGVLYRGVDVAVELERVTRAIAAIA